MNKSFSRKEFAKLHFCKKYWDTNGGDPNKRPYWDFVGDGLIGRKQRVYVSALWFPTWEQWSVAAERALTAAVVEFDGHTDRFVKSGNSYPFAEKPHFLVEAITDWRQGDLFQLWINALCPDEEQFNHTLAEAQKAAEQMRARKIQPGFKVASLFASPPPAPLYPSEWCQANENEQSIDDLLARKGIFE